VRRAYADLRAYADVGGKQEALVAPREKLATSDPAIAQTLLADRIKELESLRRGRTMLGITRRTTLAAFAREHLIAKARAGKVTRGCIAESEHHLTHAVAHFGAERDLCTITAADIRMWAEELQVSGRSGGTVRHFLNSLSNLYRRAQAEGCVIPGYNPVAALLEKPSARREEARWLEVHETALLLEAARTYQPKRTDLAMPFTYPLLAAFVLTGGRRSEVLCLEVDDISFDRRTVTFRPNHWRETLGLRSAMKTDTSWRAIPLWPQLEGILRSYVFPKDRTPRSGLLFPSYRTGEPAVCDVRKLIDAVAVRAGWKPGEITSKMFRHTYCAARLQTLDHGAPVSVYTVARELGHGGESMVRRVYGHLGAVRHRSEVVEYRVCDFLQQKVRDGQTVEAFLRSLNAGAVE
jgi:integrase